jgi:hypothetical protein
VELIGYLQALDLDEAQAELSSSESRNPSPKTLNPTTARAIVSPGITGSHGAEIR